MVRVDRHGYLKAVADAGAKRESLTARLGFEIEHLGVLIAEDLPKLDYCNSLGSVRSPFKNAVLASRCEIVQ